MLLDDARALAAATKTRSIRADVNALFQAALDEGRTELLTGYDQFPPKVFDGTLPGANVVALRFGKGLCFANTTDDVVVRLDELTGVSKQTALFGGSA